MKATEAKPGKPGTWNGRKQRWRTYVRAFRRMDPEATKRVADKEIAMKERYVRTVAWAKAIRNALVALAAVAVLAGMASLHCAARAPVTVEKGTR